MNQPRLHKYDSTTSEQELLNSASGSYEWKSCHVSPKMRMCEIMSFVTRSNRYGHPTRGKIAAKDYNTFPVHVLAKDAGPSQ